MRRSSAQRIGMRLAALMLLASFGPALLAQSEEDLDALFGTSATAQPDGENPPEGDQADPGVPVIRLPEATPRPLPTRAATLEEIVVTAQRREESLQDAPIAISAFNAEQLQIAGIDGLKDIGAKVPALQIEPFPTSNATLRFYIRGIGVIDAQVTQDPAIGVYADGVYIARSTGTAFDVADLERIEILRGPQGTLYGRNTTGGAINLITRRPSRDEIRLDQSLTVASRNTYKARTVVNLPLGEALAMKLALMGATQDGFVENTGPGGDYGDRDSLATRLDLRWWPSDEWIVDYSFDRSEIDFFNYQYQAVLTPESDKGQVEQIKREAQANSIYSHRRLRSLATGMPLEESGTTINGHALTMERDFAGFSLKYIGAYRDLLESFYTDLGGGAGSTAYRLDTNRYDGPAAQALQGAPTELLIPFIRQDQWSHELQWLGEAFDERLQYVVGAFWFREQAREQWQPIGHQFSAAISPTAGQNEALDALIRTAAPRLVAFTEILNETENESAALFGQATWTPRALDSRLHLTLGYRHTEDRRFARKTKFSPTYLELGVGGAGTAVPVASPVDLPPGPLRDALAGNVSLLANERFDGVPGRIRFSDDSISLIAAYDVSEATRAYGKYVEAYKSGGFNTRDPQRDGNSGPAADGNDYGFGFADGFDKELVKSLEIGAKSEWLDRRLRLNAAAFYTAYQDMQINFILAGTVSDTKTTNAGEARMWGIELDGSYVFSADLRLDASYAYLNAKITEVLREVESGTEDVTDQYQFNSAPRHAATLGVDATVLRRDWGDLQLNVSGQFTDRREGGANAGKPVDLPAYALLNLYLGTSPLRIGRDGSLSLGLWMRNVLDEEHEINAIDNVPHADRAVIWGEPRSFGMDLRLAF